MFRFSHHPLWSSRLTAVLGIALVLLLNVLAASPGLHARLHGQAPTSEPTAHDQAPVGDPDHECAVTVFAHGVPALVFFGLRLLARLLARSPAWLANDCLVAARPRYWLVPSHAPPLI